ncbi:N-formylglutamate amidohydrolase [Thalassobacter stenotrophicus]|uniref:N-formylglutamate amidohydrolase n=1 Tax=Thalassobacter stenotrophicus TaxID=266809 RepID=UPI0022A9B6A2|nr:N-formylglutamate amidohydrolase [Thalassobacter stenotrophicus]UYP68014.1 N-formylglutamate amidohydrolase [Thalassobacter stenotrophicus]
MTPEPYHLSLPQGRSSAVVVASPHSGRTYTPAFLEASVLDSRGIRSSEDAFVDLLLDRVPSLGAPLITADAPRAYVDLNRSQDELDPAVIEDIPRSALNPRVSSGLGVIPRVVSNGRAIYRGKISRREALARIEAIWRPYHRQLQSLLDESRTQFGRAILIDVHSMPHEAIDSVHHTQHLPPEIVLGDRFGASCNGRITDAAEAAFRRAGFRVARNAPFAGAFIAQHYGRPSYNQHVLQIEIDRSMYMHEPLIQPNGEFHTFKARFEGVLAEIVEIGGMGMRPLAAE